MDEEIEGLPALPPPLHQRSQSKMPQMQPKTRLNLILEADVRPG